MLITDAELKLIASAAIIGESSQPVNGYSTPAWCHRRGSIGIATSACWRPTRHCASQWRPHDGIRHWKDRFDAFDRLLARNGKDSCGSIADVERFPEIATGS
ncbi:MAG: hypothetical protein H0T80_03185 [Betaproteobacteria bacterium]|nr:hypothetical protein [Betaproteobacteria bacterium]